MDQSRSPAGSVGANQLLLFWHIAETGSLSRAARRLGMPRSTLSRQLAAFERLLGERLILRSTRKLHVTEFGRAMLAHAELVAEGVQDASAFAENRQAAPSGRLRISMPNHFAQTFAPGMIERFVADFPAVILDIDVSSRRVDFLVEDFDVVIRLGELVQDPSLTASRLAALPIGLYASPRYLERVEVPKTPQALPGMDGLLVSRLGEPVPWELSRITEAGESERWVGTPAVRCLVSAGELLLGMAVAGHGIAALTHALARPQLESGALVRVLPDWRLPELPAWVVFAGRKLLPAKTRAFIDALRVALR